MPISGTLLPLGDLVGTCARLCEGEGKVTNSLEGEATKNLTATIN